jgi:hypothetical protein
MGVDYWAGARPNQPLGGGNSRIHQECFEEAIARLDEKAERSARGKENSKSSMRTGPSGHAPLRNRIPHNNRIGEIGCRRAEEKTSFR